MSSTLEKVEWNNSRLITGDLVGELTKVKDESGRDILVGGSATLVQALMRHHLVDELRLAVSPVVLGTGKRLLADAGHTGLELVDHQSTGTGVILLAYRLAGQS